MKHQNRWTTNRKRPVSLKHKFCSIAFDILNGKLNVISPWISWYDCDKRRWNYLSENPSNSTNLFPHRSREFGHHFVQQQTKSIVENFIPQGLFVQSELTIDQSSTVRSWNICSYFVCFISFHFSALWFWMDSFLLTTKVCSVWEISSKPPPVRAIMNRTNWQFSKSFNKCLMSNI